MTDAVKGKRRWGLIALGIVVIPVLLFSIYAGAALNWAYSEGERAGVLQKFSHKGWVCKTWEGEIAMTTVPGVAPVMWNFTVRDDQVAKRMSSAVGQRVVLHYQEHRGVPTTCFGETAYFVDSVTIQP
ncbi:MAG TPA: hypothetical protein PLJ23_08910 [Gemmatimonadales bacterium]|mgnify:CR=1 FL=1|jgi:hypothetical protein|nr:hypothetical protein [Gemmatimonadales bacterium]